LGLGYENLKEENEKLIYCSITGYGPDGPYSDRGGYDVIASSIGGLNYITGPEDGEPCRVGVAMTDITTGLLAKSSILSALYNREKTGLGAKIDCNLLSSQVSVLTHIASNYLNCDISASRLGTAHPSIVPYQSFLTKDKRYITVGAGTNRDFKTLCERLNLPELLTNDKYKDNSSRVEHRVELLAILSQKFLEKSCEEWLNEFNNCTFPHGPINDIDQALNDPQVLHNQMIQDLEHHSLDSKIKVVGHPVLYNNDKKGSQQFDEHPSVHGESTFSTLKDILNLSDLELDNLHNLGVIVGP